MQVDITMIPNTSLRISPYGSSVQELPRQSFVARVMKGKASPDNLFPWKKYPIEKRKLSNPNDFAPQVFQVMFASSFWKNDQSALRR
jgi:hypothetical protein